MNVNLYVIKDYKNETTFRLRKYKPNQSQLKPIKANKIPKQTQYKPNTNPIKPNFRKAQMNVNSILTKDYRKKDDFAVRKNKPNSNPISERPK